jgi:hypothetical protein
MFDLKLALRVISKLIILSLAATFITGCLNTTENKTDNTTPVEGGLTDSELLTFSESGMATYQGSFPDDTGYRIVIGYSDGSSGAYLTIPYTNPQGYYFEKNDILGIDCRIDPITDKHTCTTTEAFPMSENGIQSSGMLVLTSNGLNFPHKVCIRKHDYPGEIAKIRFDKEAAIGLGTDGCSSSQSIINKVFTSKKIAVEYSEWPYVGGQSSGFTKGTKHYRDVLAYMRKLAEKHNN